MESSLRAKISRFLKEHVRRSRWHKAVTGLGCVVVFCTVYALILPAITMSKETSCGMEEHTHAEECYVLEQVKTQPTYSCDLELHKHTSDCRGEDGEWICGFADFVLHTHDELCYDAEGELICPLEEIEEHEHDSSCFEEEEQLICELEEDYHVHDDDCYTITYGALICDHNDEGGHTHDDSCYEEVETEDVPVATGSNSTEVQKKLICGLEEKAAPEHDEDCYEWDMELTCEKEESDGHLHAEECYEIQEVLVCDQVEAVLHAHEEACYDEEGKLICGLLETEEHQHTEDCVILPETEYEEVQVLVCEQTEHQHSEICFAEEEDYMCGLEEHAHMEDCYDEEGNLICELEEHTHSEECLLPEFVLMADLPGKYVDGGSLEGTGITWVVTEADNGDWTLTISGEGDMPDATSSTVMPWYRYTYQREKSIELVIESGITRVGNACFSANYFKNIKLADTITSLGINAFSYSYSSALNRIEIPASVKIIGNSCFSGDSPAPVSIILHDGLEEIGSAAFARENIGIIHIPSTVRKIGDSAFRYAEGYTVEDDNAYFCSEDGILFSKDKSILVDYPGKLSADEYQVPDYVTEIGSGALCFVRFVRRLHVPGNVQKINGALAQMSRFEEIYIEDGVPFGVSSNGGAWSFNGCATLASLRLPENASVSLGNMFQNTTCTDLRSFTFPNGTTSIANLGSGGNFKLTGLEMVRYDAADSKITQDNILGDTARFELTIGEHVNNIPFNFKYFVEHATGFVFEPNNQMTIEVGAFASAPEPLSGISGTVYVDSQGILYSYDKDAGTAAMFYCSPGLTEATIPASITPEEGVTCNVTTVKKNALKLTDRLTEITFDAPDQITSLEAYALANCPTLTSVNGKITVEEASEIFSKAELGYGVFHRTGLTGASGSGNFETDMDGKPGLTITCEGATDMSIGVESMGQTMNWKPDPKNEVTGGYKLLTGDVMKVNASVGNTEAEDDHLYRIYFQKTDETGTLSIQAGETYEFDGQKMVCHFTEDPNTVYLEFSHPVGVTISISVTAVYPSPETAGGGLTVWGVIVTTEEEKENHDKLMKPVDGTIQAYWTTEPEPFAVEKISTGNAPTVVGDGEGGGKPGINLTWQIKLTHDSKTNQTYGKDFVRSVDYTDVMTLPKGMFWKDEVIDAIRNEDTRRSGNDIYAGDLKIAAISTGGGKIQWDNEKDTAILRWTKFNPSEKAELGADTVNLTIYADAISVNMDEFTSESKIVNRIDANVHYHYSDDYQVHSEAEKIIKSTNGSLKLAKTGTKAAYFGEDITYTLTLSNPGVTAWKGDKPGSYTVTDKLSEYSYISLENMERMFEEEPYGSMLTITIEHASLSSPWEQVIGTNGEESWRHPGNSDIGEGSHTLTVSKTAEGTYQVAVTGGNTYSGDTVKDIMRQAGYSVTHDAVYTCEWTLNLPDKTLTIMGGEQRLYTIYAAAKDSFQMLSADWPSSYPVDSAVNIKNEKAVVLSPEDKQVVSANEEKTNVKREAVIDKRVYDETGKELTSAPAAKDGDVLEYRLDFTHYGSGKYEDLPMVDDLYGSQFLLVPIESNSNLSSRNLQVYNDEYYILTKGIYKNVVVGIDDEGYELAADTITVQDADQETDINLGGMTYSYTGLHTQIKWYFPYLEGGDYRKIVTYKALIDMELSGVNYTIGNVVWMNDKPGSRIYASLWGGGTIIDFDKKIVLKKGENPSLDVVDEDDYTAVGPGETVLYRLNLRNTGTGNFILDGNQLADALPQTYGVFEWKIGENVRFVEKQYLGRTLPDLIDMDKWYIGSEYGGLIGNRQYILWPDSSNITFHGPSSIALYFELTFPKDTEQEDTWSRYTAENGGSMVDNTLYVYRFPSNVLHELKEPGRVLLQKGVYSLARRDSMGAVVYRETGDNRQYYSNRETKYRSVTYYVTLYNGGNRRLYLNDLYDKLPKGFTYHQMLTDSNLTNVPQANKTVITTNGGSSLGVNPLVQMGDVYGNDSITFRSARITVNPEGENIQFRIGPGTGEYAVKYDEERKAYYLDRGEAIVFGYVADIGLTTDTEDIARNAIAMPYTDHLGTGLSLISKNEVFVQAPTTDHYPDQNDGTRLLKNGTEVQADYGFQEGNETWLVSEVKVERGGIIPGVTKITDSYVDAAEIQQKYTNSIMPQDTVNWKVLLHNSGTLALIDYTFTDVMPTPFAFEGLVTYTIYDEDHQIVGTTTNLIEFPERTGGEDELGIVDKRSGKTIQAAFNGDWHELTSNGTSKIGISFSLDRDDHGNEVLKLHFETMGGIYEDGGYVEVAFSSRNPTNSYINAVYTNQATLTPNSQPFVNVGQGTIVYEEDGDPVSVRNASPVVVSFGYATSSEKRVTEINDTNNTAVSTNPSENIILLPGKDSLFRYTLTVNNDTDNTMTELILIDNLPEPGDHSPFDTNVKRNSAFKVSLAENPGFEVKVTSKAGDPYTLESDYYTIQYSTTTDFGGPQSNDWHGHGQNGDEGTTAAWTTDPTGARAIRVIIKDDSATQIPAKAKVELSFNAKIDGEAEPATVAWNSFGYHYHLEGVNEELEAMPLVVGVKVPSVPTLEKQLEDANGQSVTAEEDVTFSFLVYEGTALEGTYETKEALKAALKADDRQYQQFDLTVSRDQSSSGKVVLKAEDWEWTKDQKYTITELPIEDDHYLFSGFNNTTAGSYTFTYDPGMLIPIICRNESACWDIQVTKRDGAGAQKPLGGAVFGLYSPNQADELQEIPEEYSDLGISLELTESGQSWYLKEIRVSDEEGMLGWSDLLEEKYYLLELKAPDGYKLPSSAGQVLYRTNAQKGVYSHSALNYAGAALPETGGPGELPFTAGGLLLFAAAVLMYGYRMRSRREADTP